MRRCALWICVLLPACLGLPGSCGPSGPPSEETCMQGSVDGVRTVEIGNPRSLYDETEPFVALTDGTPVHGVTRGQGLPMLPVRLRITGSDLPDCLPQITAAFDIQGRQLGQSRNAVQAHARPDQSRVTGPIYLIGVPPQGPLALVASVGTVTAQVR